MHGRHVVFFIFSDITVVSYSTCLKIYKKKFQSRLHLIWLQKYENKLILAAILNILTFFNFPSGENSTLPGYHYMFARDE